MPSQKSIGIAAVIAVFVQIGIWLGLVGLHLWVLSLIVRALLKYVNS